METYIGVDYNWTTTLPEKPYLGQWESTDKYTGTQVSKYIEDQKGVIID
jgi:hypothetical protein